MRRRWHSPKSLKLLRRLLVTCLVSGIRSPATAGEILPTQTDQIRSGLTVNAFNIDESDPAKAIKILVFQAARTLYRPHILAGSGVIETVSYNFPATLSELKFSDVPVIASGGYTGRIGSSLVPLGYLKSQGSVISPRPHRSWVVDGMLCVDAARGLSAILKYDDKASAMKFPDCVQTGPYIFHNGKNVSEEEQQNEQTAEEGRQKYIETPRIQVLACKPNSDQNSEFSLMITTNKVRMVDLDQELPDFRINHVKICNEAIALAGSIAAGALINDKLVAGSDSYLLESAILFGPPIEKRR